MWYEDGGFGSFLGFSLGVIIAFFHIAGMKLYVQDLLYIWVRYVVAMGPRCKFEMLSGPVAGVFLSVLIPWIVSW